MWPDTFNNYFFPGYGDCGGGGAGAAQTARSWFPAAHFCCGRPLYDYGFLGMAKNYLRRILAGLGNEIDRGTPVVVLEPSCCSVFRDELTNLFPNLPRAESLKKQTFTLSEFLERQDEFVPPTLKRKAVIHGHCHHKAVMRMKAEESMFKKIGLDYKMLDSGCCGMAGSFGFESDKYDLSVKVGERVLLPAVREAEPSTVLVADGFSCREQIAQLSGTAGSSHGRSLVAGDESIRGWRSSVS